MGSVPRALLFGFEGALIDETGLRAEVVREVLAEEGVPQAESDRSWPEPLDESIFSALDSVPSSTDRALLLARLNARVAARFQALVREREPLWVEGAAEFVAEARSRELPLGLVARSGGERVRTVLAEAGLESAFKVVVAGEESEEVGSRAESYSLAVSRLNTLPPLPERLFHPHEIVALEGTAEGIGAAAAAGVVAVAIAAEPGEGVEAALVCAGYADLRWTPTGLDRLG